MDCHLCKAHLDYFVIGGVQYARCPNCKILVEVYEVNNGLPELRKGNEGTGAGEKT